MNLRRIDKCQNDVSLKTDDRLVHVTVHSSARNCEEEIDEEHKISMSHFDASRKTWKSLNTESLQEVHFLAQKFSFRTLQSTVLSHGSCVVPFFNENDEFLER